MEIKCSAFMGASLDGYIAKADGNIEWLDHPSYEIPEEDFGYYEFYDSIDALIMGRNTFNVAVSFDEWPYKDKHVFVLSTTNPEIPADLAETVSIVSSSLEENLAGIAKKGYKHLYIDGGKTIQSFIREGLLDDITITRLPVLLGGGIPLFGEHSDDIHLTHIKTKIYDNGFVQSKYKINKEA